MGRLIKKFKQGNGLELVNHTIETPLTAEENPKSKSSFGGDARKGREWQEKRFSLNCNKE